MALGFTLFFVTLWLMRIRTALVARKIRALRMVGGEELVRPSRGAATAPDAAP